VTKYLAYRLLRARAARAVHETVGRSAAFVGRSVFGYGAANGATGEPERILAISLQKIGDAVATEPALRLLAERFPRARIEVAAAASRERGPAMGAVEVFGMMPQVAAVHAVRGYQDLRALAGENDLVLTFGLRARDAWAALVARGPRGVSIGYSWNGRGAALDRGLVPPDQIMLTAEEARERRARPQHELWADLLWRARLVDDDEATRRIGPPRLVPGEEAARDALALLRERDLEDIVAIAPWNDQAHYRWPEERWVALVKRLGRPAVIVGGHSPAECGHAKRIAGASGAVSFAGLLSLDRTAAMLARARVVVAVDSGPAHIARAVSAPTVVVFGPGSPPVWGPPGAKVVQRTEGCHGCRQPRCYQERRVCLEDLAVESVAFLAAELSLTRSESRP
jgi:ADP-heptose:LPS heptosyltransferase